MRRRIVWELGDSRPDWAHATLNVTDSGEIHIETGFRVSSANVALSKEYLNLIATYPGVDSETIRVYVKETNDHGFILNYENVPEWEPLEINYIAM